MRAPPLLIRSLLFSAVGGLVLLPGLVYGPGMDAIVFALVAWRMRNGDTPYVEVWDHKPPGIYVVDWIAQAALPGVDWWIVAWLVTLLALVATGLLVRAILRRSGVGRRLSSAGGLLAVVGAGQYAVSLGGGMTEQAAAVPAAAAMLLALAPTARRYLAAGAFAAAAIVISPQAVPVGAALLVLALPAGRQGGSLGRVAALALGGALVAFSVAAWLLAIGALPAAVDQALAYNGAYRLANVGQDSVRLARIAALSILSLLFLGLPALFGMLATRRATGDRRRIGLAAIAWIVTAVAFLFYAGGLRVHYLAPLVVPLGVLAIFGIEEVASRRRRLPPLAAAVAAAFLAATVISVATLAWFIAMEGPRTAAHQARVAQLAEVVRSRSEADDPIFVWGNSPGAYLESERVAAGPYIYLFPLTTPGYSSTEQVARLRAVWEGNPPALIVDAGSERPGAPGFAPLLVDRPLVDFDPRRLDLLDPLRDFVRERYEQVADVNGWLVYAPRT